MGEKLLGTHTKPAPDAHIRRTYRTRVALFLMGRVLVVLLLSYLYQGIQVLNALAPIELARDQWQRPADVIQALNLHKGSVVVDFGSGEARPFHRPPGRGPSLVADGEPQTSGKRAGMESGAAELRGIREHKPLAMKVSFRQGCMT